jgi:hypothetical protein
MTKSGTGFAGYVDELVVGARADRDGAFNTLDAINRQTRAASDRLAGQVDQFLADAKDASAEAAVTGEERDARFDPEDEWDLPSVVHPGGGAADPPQPGATRDDEDDDFADTWLR